MKRMILAALVTLSLSAAARAQVSLWQGKAAAAAKPAVMAAEVNLLREGKSRDFQVHDIVSIIVSLSAEASTDEQADFEKKSSKNNIAINQYLKLQRDGMQFDLKGVSPSNLGLDMTADKKFEGDGATDRTDTLRTRVAAEIIDIKPNGNLVIEARHTFTKQREKTMITLSGIVRPQDVGADNTVYSYNVADADIRYESSGPVTDANKRGWLGKFLDKVWPF